MCLAFLPMVHKAADGLDGDTICSISRSNGEYYSVKEPKDTMLQVKCEDPRLPVASCCN